MTFDGTNGDGLSLARLLGLLGGTGTSDRDLGGDPISQALAESARRARLPRVGGLFGGDYARYMADRKAFARPLLSQPPKTPGSAAVFGPQAVSLDGQGPEIDPSDQYQVAGPAAAKPFPNKLDPIIEAKVAAYNRMNQADPGDEVYLDPDWIKAMVRVESGHDLKAYNSDPMQVNKPGDWDAPPGEKGYKSDLGLKEGVPPGAEQGIQAGLDWLDSKSYFFDKKGRAKPFIGYDRAIQRYNGGGNPHYLEDVKRAYRDIKSDR
ncbi:MAG TPA: hypothetical protein VJS38_02540 [Phenylobacterium sp.]|uniref:hypothetical protein n=1 Tax=Phenylobacterium sp. TaxID=1871053 RepID=UPI002B4989AF|nr:hypothetical protein [Phenylobacterium sp.]HKR87027.1 hypothetical protein [Phenylobacterium sp.]